MLIDTKGCQPLLIAPSLIASESQVMQVKPGQVPFVIERQRRPLSSCSISSEQECKGPSHHRGAAPLSNPHKISEGYLSVPLGVPSLYYHHQLQKDDVRPCTHLKRAKHYEPARTY